MQLLIRLTVLLVASQGEFPKVHSPNSSQFSAFVKSSDHAYQSHHSYSFHCSCNSILCCQGLRLQAVTDAMAPILSQKLLLEGQDIIDMATQLQFYFGAIGAVNEISLSMMTDKLLWPSAKDLATTTTWTDKEYFDGWKKTKKDTSSAPGLSFSQIKCITKGTISGWVLSQLAMTPLVLGITPDDWQEATEVLIPKKAANLRPEKLRRITQFSVQMNHNKKMIRKTMMQHAERHGFLAEEQYGSRKGK